MTNITREELEAALTTLTGDNGRICPVSALSNPEAVGHERVTKALCIAMEDECFTGYLDRYEWDAMNDEERAEYAEDYEGFCEVCDSYNSSVINNAVRMLEKKIEEMNQPAVKKFKVRIVEQLERTIDVDAVTGDDALAAVRCRYFNGEIVLGADDITGDVEFYLGGREK